MSRNDEFENPSAITIDPIGKNIYVTSSANPDIQVFDYDGNSRIIMSSNDHDDDNDKGEKEMENDNDDDRNQNNNLDEDYPISNTLTNVEYLLQSQMMNKKFLMNHLMLQLIQKTTPSM